MWSRGSQVHTLSQTSEKAQLTDCMVEMSCTVGDKTTQNVLSMGTMFSVMEKAGLSNCVVMENVVIETFSGKSSRKLSTLGRGHKTAEGIEMISQLVLDSDRVMEVCLLRTPLLS